MLIVILLLALVVTIPYFLLRASGYRLDTATFRFVPTGAIAVTAVPIGTTVTIEDGETSTKRITPFSTTAFFPDLLPGTYRATAEFAGRRMWLKTATVVSQETTAFSFVRLFPEAIEPIATFKRSFSGIAINPDGETAIAWGSMGLEHFSLETGGTIGALGQLIQGTVKNAHWIGQTRLLVTFMNGSGLLIEGFHKDPTKETLRVLPLPTNIVQIAPALKNGALFRTIERALIRFTFPSGNTPTPTPLIGKTIAQDVALFAVHGRAVTYLDTSGIAWTQDIETRNTTQRSVSHIETDTPLLTIVASRHGTALLVLDEDGGAWLLPHDSERFSLIAEGIRDAVFSFDDKKLLLAGRREVSLYALKDRLEQPVRRHGERVTITRFAEPIVEIAFLAPEEEYAVVLTRSQLSILELDTRGGQNSWQKDDITAFTMFSGPERLFLSDARGNLFVVPVPVPGFLSNLLL